MPSAIVVTAGRSARKGEANKLLVPWRGRPREAQACAFAAGEVIAATGFQHRAVTAGLAHPHARAIFNEFFVKSPTPSVQTRRRTGDACCARLISRWRLRQA